MNGQEQRGTGSPIYIYILEVRLNTGLKIHIKNDPQIRPHGLEKHAPDDP